MSIFRPLLPGTIGIILNEKEEILLVKRKDVPIWVLPGGGIDKGETPEKAIVREVKEETGLNVIVLEKRAEYRPVNHLTAFTSVFTCKISSGNLELSEETQAIHFFPLKSLPKAFFFLHANWLNEILLSRSLVQRSITEISYSAVFIYLLKHPWIVIRFAWTRITKS